MTHSEETLDLVALLALGVLRETEARDVAAHFRTCAECRAVFAELRPVADLVGLTSDTGADQVSAARIKARVMAVVHEDAAQARNGSARRGRRRGGPLAPWFGAAAAVVVAALIGADDLSFRSRAERSSSEQRSQVALLAGQKQAVDARLGALLGPGNRHFAVPQGEVVTQAGHLFIAVNLPPAPAGKVYQAWTLAKGAKAVMPSITFSPAADGVAFVEIPQSAAGLAAVAVSIEPAGGSKAPTSAPKFVRKLS